MHHAQIQALKTQQDSHVDPWRLQHAKILEKLKTQGNASEELRIASMNRQKSLEGALKRKDIEIRLHKFQYAQREAIARI